MADCWIHLDIRWSTIYSNFAWLRVNAVRSSDSQIVKFLCWFRSTNEREQERARMNGKNDKIFGWVTLVEVLKSIKANWNDYYAFGWSPPSHVILKRTEVTNQRRKIKKIYTSFQTLFSDKLNNVPCHIICQCSQQCKRWSGAKKNAKQLRFEKVQRFSPGFCLSFSFSFPLNDEFIYNGLSASYAKPNGRIIDRSEISAEHRRFIVSPSSPSSSQWIYAQWRRNGRGDAADEQWLR